MKDMSVGRPIKGVPATNREKTERRFFHKLLLPSRVEIKSEALDWR
jgi:hypothetical protein